ncbi:MAG: hypothetical protein IPG71_12505 [bacterium]|nr:hypothetical protein [bacterium]
MSSLLGLLLVCFSLIGCDDPAGYSASPNWAVDGVIAGARAPVMSHDGQYVLFTREGTDGGLYLWHHGAERCLTGGGVAIRPDYVWSCFDQSLVAFSIPGSSTEGAGVYVMSTTDQPMIRMSTHGRQPQFAPNELRLLFAGGSSDTATQGIWSVSLLDGISERLTAVGERPRLNPDGEVLAYLIPQVGSNGATLITRSLRTGTNTWRPLA